MNDEKFASQINTFSANLFEKLVILHADQNVIFSPFAIHVVGGMIWLGAEGNTAKELGKGLGFTTCNVKDIIECYYKVLTTYAQSNILCIANKIYVRKDCIVNEEYGSTLSNKFLTEAEEIEFQKSQEAAEHINGWVDLKTNGLIKELISAENLDSSTSMVLVNAIYFKGEWVKQFSKEATKLEDFHLNDTETAKIEMMNMGKTTFNYIDLPEYDATALQMNYKDSDLLMVIILPNQTTGIKMFESNLKPVNLQDIIKRMEEEDVIVKLPKFKAECFMELTEAFKKLGVERMFTFSAEFDKMLQNPVPLQVSSILHKVYIDVNEEGTEAAAATAGIMMTRTAPQPPQHKIFYADHPFYFAILNKDGYPFFAGKYEKVDSIAGELENLDSKDLENSKCGCTCPTGSDPLNKMHKCGCNSKSKGETNNNSCVCKSRSRTGQQEKNEM